MKKMKRYFMNILESSNYIIREIWKIKKVLLGYGIIKIILSLVIPVIPSVIVSGLILCLQTGKSMAYILSYIVFSTLIATGIHVVERICSLEVDDSYAKLKYTHQTKLIEKTLDMEYELYTNKEINDLYNRGYIAIESGEYAWFYDSIVLGVTGIIGILFYGIKMIEVSPFIIAIVVVSNIIAMRINRVCSEKVFESRKELGEIEEEFKYLIENGVDADVAKELKVFHLQTLFGMRMKKNLKQYQEIVGKNRNIKIMYMSAALIIEGFIDILAFILFLVIAFKAKMDVSLFLIYFSMMITFGQWMKDVVSVGNDLNEYSYALNDYRKFMKLNIQKGGSSSKIHCDKIYKIEFRNVCYKYPSKEKYVLKDCNFVIRKDEKIAIVGENGAGKSTIVKLICGLIKPTAGMILINNRNIDCYSKESYFEQIAAVFQENNLLPISIVENIAMKSEEKVNIEWFWRCIKMANVDDLLSDLPLKEKTNVNCSINESGTMFSGGEIQKLMLARALYKNSSLIIFDEPTSALDAIAESRTYSQYQQLSNGKIAIYISHRYASNKFCDRILYLEKGKILEKGSFQDLLKLNGKYANLYRLQAKYYEDDRYL